MSGVLLKKKHTILPISSLRGFKQMEKQTTKQRTPNHFLKELSSFAPECVEI